MQKLIIFSLALFPSVLLAQETELKEAAIKTEVKAAERVDGWLKGGSGTFTFSQVSLTNWAGGGQNSVAANAFINLFANYKKGKSVWDNNLDLAYGVIRQGSGNFIKSDDRIDLMSKYGRLAIKKWNYAALLNFRTQMAPGYDLSSPTSRVRISDILAPAYVMISLGMDYKPNENFTFFLSPVTGKITIVNDQPLADAGAFGVQGAVFDELGVLVTAGEKIRGEFGGYMKMSFKRELWENAVFTTKLDLFSNYANNPQNIDIFWDNSLLIKVGKYLGVNFGFTMVYDHDILIGVDQNGDGIIEATGPRTQMKQVFGFGLSYKL
jgi:hypothetical protein